MVTSRLTRLRNRILAPNLCILVKRHEASDYWVFVAKGMSTFGLFPLAAPTNLSK